MIKNKTNGFSLFEVLLSMIIVSAILVLMLPLTTKLVKPVKKKTNAAIFTYNNPTNNNTEFPCYVTEIDDSGKLILTKNSGKCDSYEFYVPKGVHKIDLTMVAGGGGGGGASGEIEHVFNMQNKKDASLKLTFLQEKIKKIFIKYLTGRGGAGEEIIANASTLLNSRSGNSGRAASMVYNYEIPFEKLPKTPEYLFESWSYTIAPWNCTNSGCKYNNGDLIQGKAFYAYQIKEHYSNNHNTSTSRYIVGAKNALDDETTESEGCLDTIEEKNIHKENLSYKLSETMNCINSPTEINKGTKPTESDKNNRHFIISGAKEKRALSHISAGAGGEGASLIGINDSSSGWKYKSEPETLEFPENEGGEIEVTLAYPAAVASGGTAGTVVKLNGLSVKPNEKYTIVVGSGGVGGLSGKKGLLNNNIKEYTIFPTNGENGQGGSTTAIYKEDGELLFMVAGGIGGYGGVIYKSDSNINSNAEILLDKWKNGLNPYEHSTDKATPLPALPKMAANKPLLIYGGGFDVDKVEVDGSIIDINNFYTTSNSTYTFGTEKTKQGAFTYNYKYSTETLSPIKNLTIDENDAATIKKNRSFSNYFQLFDNDENSIDPSISTDSIFKYINGKPLYNGLYFRYNPEGKDLMYAGGLGGFSAISPKAGCGGAFVGNYDGRLNEIDYHTGDAELDPTQQGTFTITENGNSNTYFINDFFDNCTINSSDGQSANFIPPQVSGSSINFGNAGAGGGGGGWSKLLGSGKGGNGQNGYVLINWD